MFKIEIFRRAEECRIISFLNAYIALGGGLFFVLHRCGVTQRGLPISHGYGSLIIAESLSIQGAFLKCPIL